jgi:hypothetical protein
MLLASSSCLDDGKNVLNVKVEYLEKEGQFGDSGNVYPFCKKNKVQANLEPPLYIKLVMIMEFTCFATPRISVVKSVTSSHCNK